MSKWNPPILPVHHIPSFQDNWTGSFSNCVKIASSSTDEEYRSCPLYPHRYDDLVFMIFQRGKLMEDLPRSSITPIMQWFLIIFIASLVLHFLRTTVKQRSPRNLRPINDAGMVRENCSVSFVDSVAVFLGIALEKLGNGRAERWFLISFSIFGLIFRIFYTDNLFVLFTAADEHRITSIDQIFDANIPITVDYAIVNDHSEFLVRIKSWVNSSSIHEFYINYNSDLFQRNNTYRKIRTSFIIITQEIQYRRESFAHLTLRRNANHYMLASNEYEPRSAGDLYILDEAYGNWIRKNWDICLRWKFSDSNRRFLCFVQIDRSSTGSIRSMEIRTGSYGTQRVVAAGSGAWFHSILRSYGVVHQAADPEILGRRATIAVTGDYNGKHLDLRFDFCGGKLLQFWGFPMRNSHFPSQTNLEVHHCLVL